MKEYSDYMSAIQLVENAFVGDIKRIVEDKVMTELLNEFESRARPLIREGLEKVTLAAIERSLDMMQIKDKLKVQFYHKDIVEHKVVE